MSRKTARVPIQGKQASHTPILRKSVKVIKLMCARSPAHHVARGRKTLQTHGFPIQSYGGTSKGHNLAPMTAIGVTRANRVDANWRQLHHDLLYSRLLPRGATGFQRSTASQILAKVSIEYFSVGTYYAKIIYT
jgi:hypothetical protein